jgi:hypothetical protein
MGRQQAAAENSGRDRPADQFNPALRPCNAGRVVAQEVIRATSKRTDEMTCDAGQAGRLARDRRDGIMNTRDRRDGIMNTRDPRDGIMNNGPAYGCHRNFHPLRQRSSRPLAEVDYASEGGNRL